MNKKETKDKLSSKVKELLDKLKNPKQKEVKNVPR